MDKEQLLSYISQMEHKVKNLVEAYNALKVENHVLKTENTTYKEQVINKEEQIKSFHNQEKISKIALSMADHTHDRTELKFKINEYIKEIDKCIAHLSE